MSSEIYATVKGLGIWRHNDLKCLLVLGLSLMIKPASPSLVILPNNTAVVKGESFSLQCVMRPEGGITNINWWNPWNVIVATNGKAESRYYVTYVAQNGSSALTSVYTDLTYAGTYCCVISVSEQQVKLCAEIILLDSHQVECRETREIYVEGETIDPVCKINYVGRWAPILQWSSSMGIEEADSLNETDATAARYRLAMVAHRSLQDSTFTCRGRFDQPMGQMPKNHASNNPSFTFLSCQTKEITIYWPPTKTSMHFLPKKDVYEENDTVLCLCETNPMPSSTRWLTSDGNAISGNKTLRMPPTGEYTYICEVTNDVGTAGLHDFRVETSILQFSVESAGQDDIQSASNINSTKGNRILIIGLVAGIVALLIVVVTGVVLIVRRKKIRSCLNRRKGRNGEPMGGTRRFSPELRDAANPLTGPTGDGAFYRNDPSR